MEFQEAVMRVVVQKPTNQRVNWDKHEKPKWKVSLHRSSSKHERRQKLDDEDENPKEFLCPISGSLINDPVIVSSGHTFERACVQACQTLAFAPLLPDGITPDFSNVIPNLALKSAILSWCHKCSIDPPKPLDFFTAEKIVRAYMASHAQNSPDSGSVRGDDSISISEKDLIQRVEEKPSVKFIHSSSDITPRPTHTHSSSDESIETTMSTPPLQFAARPSCFSSSSSDNEALNPYPNPEEEELITKMKSPHVFEVEEAVMSLRKITRTREDGRITLCTSRLLSALRSLIISRYTNIQVNSVACLVNLSLETVNKVKIVRSGIIPPLIDVLKAGSPEAQEHACGAIFSLALDDDNKTAIGVLGALPPLLHLLRSDSERTRHDSALALYHLSLVHSNRTKLIKLGSVQVLLAMARSVQMANRILLTLCNLASCVDGRAAMLDSGAVECLVGKLREGEMSESTRESCLAALFGLSHGGLRFKGLAQVAGAEEVLERVEKTGNERVKEKARSILETMKAKSEEEEEEQVDWEMLLLDSGSVGGSGHRLGVGNTESRANSSEF
ncbi:U-box domain-containing protein 40-like [Tripterygium wilfordii]|uniref:RING-type E3 ubiquitin transferase n=1 Tax=Tripterygium wilfordii TaxID=458696 RepID=A0A7J7CZX6_TRIWF|nr:U-box domain-containing protein 40 [Tripterygium wilfordii]KAF5739641.1 U-box domain-containing protein 40-like [Tripterygium wilfordii]